MLTLATHVQLGSTGSLGLIEVHVVDAWGNPVTPENSFEVTLKPAALAADSSGRAAKVTAHSSNRSKLQDGVATFRDVQLKADLDGAFTLVVYCKSRSVVRARQHLGALDMASLRVQAASVASQAPFCSSWWHASPFIRHPFQTICAVLSRMLASLQCRVVTLASPLQSLEEGTAVVRLQPSNAVLDISILEQSIPLEPVTAGASLPVAVLVRTEDGKAPQWLEAVHALTLNIIAPGSNSKSGRVRSTVSVLVCFRFGRTRASSSASAVLWWAAATPWLT